MGRTTVSPSVPSSPPAGAAPLRPVSFVDGAVCLDGVVILDNVTQNAWISRETDTLVLGVESPDGPDSLVDFALGTLHCKRWLCCARNKMWWMTPEWGTTAAELPPETQASML